MIGGEVLKADRELIIKASKGDKNAFSDLYRLCYRDLYNFAFHILNNPEYAADAVSDTFVEIWKGIGKLRNPDSFAAWAFKILTIRCKSELSAVIRRRDEIDCDDFYEVPFTAETNIEKEVTENVALSSAFSKLDTDEKIILVLYVLHGYKQREIAEMVGKSRSTVASKLYRAYEKLRKMTAENQKL